jgi:hypothetical protein
MMNVTENADQPPPSPQADARQMLLVGGMLVLIIVLLAMLWVRERRARIAAQANVVALRQRLQNVQMMGALGSLQPGMPTTLPLGEDNIPASAPAENAP